MFVGHYTPSFGFRRACRAPLCALFIAAQFVDILWSMLVIAGIERVQLVPGHTASSPLVLEYMPYSHSLSATLTSAVLIGMIASVLWARRSGLVVAACVAAHWILDLLVHVPDLPLLGNRYKVGFGLWDYPVAAFAAMGPANYLGLAAVAGFLESRFG